MKVEVLVSTMNVKNKDDIIENLNINDCVIINQITKTMSKIKDDSKTNKKMFNYMERGLSKSRNKALSKSVNDICIIADDDMLYVDDYERIVCDAYKKYKDADIIAFVVEHEDKKYEKKIYREGRVSYLKSMKLSSVQITLKRKSIVSNNMKFDESFGAGSKYPWGEENIFLFDCLRKKLKIYYVPVKIGILRKTDVSSWDKTKTMNHYNNQGIIFYRMTKRMYPFLIIQHVLRKRKNYRENLTSLQVLKAMFEGVKKHKRGLM